MNEHAKNRLEEIMGPPLLIPSELKGGELVTIYPHCDHDALKRFQRNHKINDSKGGSRMTETNPTSGE